MQHCSLSLILDKELTDTEMQSFETYLRNLNANESRIITVSKINERTGIDSDKIARILLYGSQIKIFSIRYVVKCPICGHLIKEITKDNLQSAYYISECYMCNEEIEVSDKDIINIFSFDKDKFPFQFGQIQLELDKVVVDAQLCDSLAYLKKIGEQLEMRNNFDFKKYEDEKVEREKIIMKLKYKVELRI